jgi:hypothetical protein
MAIAKPTATKTTTVAQRDKRRSKRVRRCHHDPFLFSFYFSIIIIIDTIKQT